MLMQTALSGVKMDKNHCHDADRVLQGTPTYFWRFAVITSTHGWPNDCVVPLVQKLELGLRVVLKIHEKLQKYAQNHLKDHNFSKIHCLIFLCSITRASKFFYEYKNKQKRHHLTMKVSFCVVFISLHISAISWSSWVRNILCWYFLQYYLKKSSPQNFGCILFFFCVFHRDDNETKGRHEQRKKRNYQKSSNAKAVFN